MYICIYVYMYICIYVYTYICIDVFTYICIYVYIYMHDLQPSSCKSAELKKPSAISSKTMTKRY